MRTVEVFNSKSTGANAFSISEWFDTNRYKELGITYNLNSAVNNLALVQWSNDGVNIGGEEDTLFPQTAGRFRQGHTPTKARYVRLLIKNADASSRNISAWLYLK